MFSGSIVALITPMDTDGAVDYGSLKRLVDFHLSNQTDALVIMGTTGESVTLSFAEQRQVLEAVLVQGHAGLQLAAGQARQPTLLLFGRTQAHQQLAGHHGAGHEGAAAIHPGHVGEFPDIAQPDGRAGCSEDETPAREPEVLGFFTGHASPVCFYL